MKPGAIFKFELSGSGGVPDRIDLWNYLSFGDQLALNNNAINLSLLGVQTGGNCTFDLFSFYSNNGVTLVDSGITSGLVVGTLGVGITSASLNYTGETIELSYSVIPEPGTSLLLLLAAAGLLAARRRETGSPKGGRKGRASSGPGERGAREQRDQ